MICYITKLIERTTSLSNRVARFLSVSFLILIVIFSAIQIRTSLSNKIKRNIQLFNTNKLMDCCHIPVSKSRGWELHGNTVVKGTIMIDIVNCNKL